MNPGLRGKATMTIGCFSCVNQHLKELEAVPIDMISVFGLLFAPSISFHVMNGLNRLKTDFASYDI